MSGGKRAPRPGVSRALTVVGGLAVLVLALSLRLPHGELAEWKGDEAIQFATARSIAREGARPIRGKPSTDGPRMAVHYFYVLAAPLVFEDSPEAVRVGVALLASGTIALLFLAGGRDLGGASTLGAALLLATLPALVRSGRSAWHPNLIVPLGVLELLALARTIRAPRGRGAGVLLFLSGLLPLIHYSLVGLGLFGGVTCAVAGARGADRRSLGVGLSLVLLLYAPHVVSEARSGFEDTLGAIRIARGTSGANAPPSPAPPSPEAGASSRAPEAAPWASPPTTPAPGTTPLPPPPEAPCRGPLARPEKAPLAYLREALVVFDLAAFARALGPRGERAARERGLPMAHLLGRALDPRVALGACLCALSLLGAALGLVDLARAFGRRVAPGPGGIAVLFLLASWGPFLLLHLPAREHYARAVAPALALLAVLPLVRVRVWCRDAAPGARTALALAGALFLLGVAAGGVLETRAALLAVEGGAAEAGSVYDLPIRDKRAAVLELLQRDLELRRYPRFEYVILYQTAFRELARRSPERTRSYELVPYREPYWELEAPLPHPRVPRGAGILLVTDQAGRLPGEVFRAGAVVLVAR